MNEFKVPVLPNCAPKPSEPGVPDKLVKSDGKLSAKSQATLPAATTTYKVPKWSAPPDSQRDYALEVLKSGQIIDEIKQLQQRPIWTFGRMPDNNLEMGHPTISRYHAVMQYKPKYNRDDNAVEGDDSELQESEQPEGWYIYDLGSTHGTFLNKQRVPPHIYIRMRVGHMLKLGASTRIFILKGPAEDEEPESELTVTELRKQREEQQIEAALEKGRKAAEAEERERNEGASWGMAEDADEETDLTYNPYASNNDEKLSFDDPKRTLRGYFEREGLPLEYKCDEVSQASFVCRVELPLDDSNGRPIVVEVSHKGRKKDCVVQCALEACRMLDRHGVLRQANQESQKRKQVKHDDSDDDDDFWDRTGDVARKKQRKENTGANVTLTYEDLLQQEIGLKAELKQIEKEISNYQENEKRLKDLAVKQANASDDLDNFMETLNEDVAQVDKTEIKKLRLEEQRIKGEQLKLQRLIKIAKPTVLPFVTAMSTAAEGKSTEVVGSKKQLPMIGKRNQFSKFKVVKSLPSTRAKTEAKAFASDEEEVEEEEVVEKEQVKEQETEASSTIPTTAAKPIVATEGNKEGTAAVTTENVEQITTTSESIEQTTPAVAADSTTEAAAVDTEDDLAQKKRRMRVRQRNKQQHQDAEMEELNAHEDSEKYAKWVPPTNQSGDGITHLNEKFGY